MKRTTSGFALAALVSGFGCSSSPDAEPQANAGASAGGAGQVAGGGGQVSQAGSGGQGVPGGTGQVSGGSAASGTSAGQAGAGGVGVSGGGPAGGFANGGAGSPGTGGAPSTDVCTRWKADRADMSEGTWSGNVASCMAGDLSANARANALRLVNLYRFLAGLPDDVTTDPTYDSGNQACALMMKANDALNHMPPTTWTCYTKPGADSAGQSNISSGRAVMSVDLYMIDTGNATTLGHRRWLMSNTLGPIGIGGTDGASCLHVFNGKGKGTKAFVAWPPGGTVPLQAITRGKESLDKTGWSIQSDKIDLKNAQVAVTLDGVSKPVTVTQLLPNYGAAFAIDFIPQGWSTEAGKSYAVSVSGVATPISYTVNVVDCK